MTFKELEKLLKRAGWTLHATREVHIFITCTHNEQTKSLCLITREIFL